jgi:hypothetical protein
LSLGSGKTRIDHNTISNSGKLDGQTVNGMDGIMVDTRETIPAENSLLVVTNNTISGFTGFGVRFYKTFDTYAKGNIICNNTGTVNIAAGIDWTSNCVEGNQPPVAKAGSDISTTAQTVTLDGSASSDADGTIVSYQWTKISGPDQFSIAAATLAKTGILNLVPGIYRFALTVTDNKGATGKDTVQVTVNRKPNLVPYAVISNKDTALTMPVSNFQLNGSSSVDPDGQITTYRWTLISGASAAVIANASQAVTAVNNLSAGIYVFGLTVTDNNGAQASTRITITVTDNPDKSSQSVSAAKATIYPNPVRDVLNVQLAGKVSGKISLSVFDAMGHLMLTKSVEKSSSSMVEKLDVAAFGQGTYFLVILSKEEKTVLKFIKYR